MKDTRPIEQQVAELTEVQQKQIVKIFWGNLIGIIALVLLLILPIVSLSAAAGAANAKHEQIWAEIEANEASGVYNFELFDLSEEALDRYYDLIQLRLIVIIVCGILLISLSLIGALIIYRKYPYYSDQKFFYINKMRKSKNL